MPDGGSREQSAAHRGGGNSAARGDTGAIVDAATAKADSDRFESMTWREGLDVLLCSSAGAWITGQTINVDGGWVLRP